jgi:signal transduction histidine kinase
MATLSALVRALENQPNPARRSELVQLAVEHAAHAQAVLREAAGMAADLSDRSGPAVPLRQVLPSVAATVSGGRLTVSASPRAERWPVHPQHTRQILINLVGNAARYSAGGIHLRARLRSRRLRLTVADGGGPNADLLRALGRRTPPADDKGLGLWLVRQLVAAHGGHLRAHALRTGGLVMEVVLPRHRH